jgi:hypothetical protein
MSPILGEHVSISSAAPPRPHNVLEGIRAQEISERLLLLFVVLGLGFIARREAKGVGLALLLLSGTVRIVPVVVGACVGLGLGVVGPLSMAVGSVGPVGARPVPVTAVVVVRMLATLMIPTPEVAAAATTAVMTIMLSREGLAPVRHVSWRRGGSIAVLGLRGVRRNRCARISVLLRGIAASHLRLHARAAIFRTAERSHTWSSGATPIAAIGTASLTTILG